MNHSPSLQSMQDEIEDSFLEEKNTKPVYCRNCPSILKLIFINTRKKFKTSVGNFQKKAIEHGIFTLQSDIRLKNIRESFNKLSSDIDNDEDMDRFISLCKSSSFLRSSSNNTMTILMHKRESSILNDMKSSLGLTMNDMVLISLMLGIESYNSNLTLFELKKLHKEIDSFWLFMQIRISMLTVIDNSKNHDLKNEQYTNTQLI